MEDQGTTTGQGLAVEPPLHARIPVFGHHSLNGTHRARLEGNGRLVIPAAVRAPYVAVGAAHVVVVDTCLWVMTPRSFELNADAVVAENVDLLPTNYRTTLYAAAPSVSVDKQARIVIPPDHRHQVGMDGEADIVVTGSVDHLEIWRAAEWDVDHAPAVNQAGLIFKGRQTLPTGGE